MKIKSIYLYYLIHAFVCIVHRITEIITGKNAYFLLKQKRNLKLFHTLSTSKSRHLTNSVFKCFLT